MEKQFQWGTTFVLTALVLVGTWFGVWLNMFDPGIWEGVITVVIPAYVIRSGAHAFANRKNNK